MGKIKEGREEQPILSLRAPSSGQSQHQAMGPCSLHPTCSQNEALLQERQRLGAQGSPPACLQNQGHRCWPRSWHSLRPDLQVVVAGVAHLTEAGDKEVVAAVVGRGVLLDVGKLHELGEEKQRLSTEDATKRV